MPSSSTRRAQTEPTVALVALFAVSVGVSLYAGILTDVSATVGTDRGVATPTLERIHDAASTAGIVSPSALDDARNVGPNGYDLNVTLRSAGQTWRVGSIPPAVVGTFGSADGADSAGRSVSVRIAPGRVRPGRLRVVVWS